MNDRPRHSTPSLFRRPGFWAYLLYLFGLGVMLASEPSYRALFGVCLAALVSFPMFGLAQRPFRRARSRKAKAPSEPALRESRPARTCVYCRSELAGEQAALSCQGCGSAYHPACFAELGRCAALGCGPALERASLKERNLGA